MKKIKQGKGLPETCILMAINIMENNLHEDLVDGTCTKVLVQVEQESHCKQGGEC